MPAMLLHWVTSFTFGLHRHLTMIFGTLISAFVAAVLYLNVQTRIELLEHRLETRIDHLSQLAVEVTHPHLENFDVQGIQRIYDRIYEQDDVRYENGGAKVCHGSGGMSPLRAA